MKKIWTSSGVPRKNSIYERATTDKGFEPKTLAAARMAPKARPRAKDSRVSSIVTGIPSAK